ncbi:sodium/calcium exchanger 1 isoform X2 [Cimex lectularius]|uniref:Calx-beta domain-containing protein n=1 Tax=Cimex lectularius TaxID=79782 RepID=A0A8I6RVD6_CIMLE|nr:sodium/calcium exchanger 1 isoform X2 [Cimex lectularius]
MWFVVLSFAAGAATVTASDVDSNETGQCQEGLIVPLWEPTTNLTTSDRIFRGSVYFFALMYLFLGVSIISDRFMSAIEVITSQEKKVSIKSKGERKTMLVRVWNETVANLTLMALGSSAPEIMLSVIEIWAKNFQAGDLGPGTIVGSAAYNLFVIIAICVSVIPNGESRTIKHLSVFFVTATWSIFAYIWLYVILAVSSKGVVDVWEGLLTFIFFPLTVLTAFIADKKIPIHKIPLKLIRRFKSHSAVGAVESVDMELSKSDYDDFEEMLENARQQSATLLKDLRKEFPDKSMAELKTLAKEKMEQSGPKSRAFYRIQATRSITGGSISQRGVKEPTPVEEKISIAEVKDDNTYVRFEKEEHTVLENIGTFVVKIVLDGPPLTVPLMVDYQSEDGSAQAGSDYMAVSGTLIFKPGQKEQLFKIKIIDDDVFEEDEHFFVRLSNVRVQGAKANGLNTTFKLGEPSVTKINILDDDHSGVFGFPEASVEVSESVGVYEIVVERKTGARGRVKVPYYTEDGTAKAGKDYIDLKGTLLFDNNESRKIIPLRVISENSYERNSTLTVHLSKPVIETSTNPLRSSFRGHQSPNAEKVALEGLPVLGEVSVLHITIKESLEFKDTVDMLVETRASPFIVGTTSWGEQFADAIKVKGGDDDDGEPPSCFDYFLHVLTIFWKILFAFVPPTDTFASKVSAIQDSTADNSIGNVTGSNAVNVFLGIGIAWSIAAIYHSFHGNAFIVPPGNLAFSVTIFCTEALIAITIIVMRRCKFIGGELGGATIPKYLTSLFFFSLWVFYVVMSTLEVYHVIEGF